MWTLYRESYSLVLRVKNDEDFPRAICDIAVLHRLAVKHTGISCMSLEPHAQSNNHVVQRDAVSGKIPLPVSPLVFIQ
jgi:hypothetical protein